MVAAQVNEMAELSSPQSAFQAMSVVVASDAQAPERQKRLSLSLNEKQFRCRFDPMNRGRRSLVLRFDAQGRSSLEEMSRGDLLKLTEEVARYSTGNAHCASGSENSQGKLDAPALSVSSATCDVQRVHIRDIRKLDDAFSVSNEPYMTIRKQAILMNADPIRAIIMRNVCLVFVPDGADSLLQILKESFGELLIRQHSDSTSPYEFQALEAVLVTLTRFFQIDLQSSLPLITANLDRLAHGKISAQQLETLRGFKNSMHELESQLNGIRRMLMEILDSEEDLHLLYLSKLHAQPSLLSNLFSFDSEEAEVLLENYLQDIYTIRSKVTLTQLRIQNTESLVMLKLDTMRNYLLGVDLMFSLIAISLAVGTFVTGAFGMNLTSHVEEADGWFWSVFGFTTLLILTACAIGVGIFKRKGVFM